MKPDVITTPIALCRTNSAIITLRWFVQRTEYRPDPCSFRPLVNGAEAFAAVHDAIVAAKTSIDIVCWGFQPSMYFKRGTPDAKPIGRLLAEKGEQGVQVRLLCWQDDTGLAQWAENPMPGNNIATSVKPIVDWLFGKPIDPEESAQRDFDLKWYVNANCNNRTGKGTLRERIRMAAIYKACRVVGRGFENIALATRGFSAIERTEINFSASRLGKNTEHPTGALNSAAMAIVPTHHQKMVLIDYESPKDAVGFVMGHNMLDAYWDHDHHSHVRMAPDKGRNGQTPRQDISSRVTGPILHHLNRNFCEAWDDATSENLGDRRKGLERDLKFECGGDTVTMAQVLRTQPQKDKYEILDLYLQVLNNATRLIYIENQYFRFPQLAVAIRKAAGRQFAKGRDAGKHGCIHLFVVTNSSDDGIGPGAYNTYRMLEVLGRADVMPGVAKFERTKARNKRLAEELERLDADVKRAKQRVDDYRRTNPTGGGDPIEASYAREAQITIDYAPEKRERIEAEMNKPPEEVLPVEIEGVKVHICTLVAPDSPPGKWDYVYVHSKLMIVDDVFMTLGSANINKRSMKGDSELNICHEHGGITGPLRKRLWNIHTNGLGAQEDVGDAFKKWGDIISENKRRQRLGNAQPYASLIEFLRTSTDRKPLD